MWSPKRAIANCFNCANNERSTSTESGHNRVDGTGTARQPNTIPVAVVGVACRLPGNVTSPSKLWDICSGGSSQDESPSPTPTLSDRSGVDSAYYTDGSAETSPRKKQVESSSSQEDFSLFTGSFLGVTVDELNTLDSEARILLKIAYEATENAGLPIESLAGTTTSVFTGFHGESLSYPHSIKTKNSTQLSSSISNLYDLRGASMSIDAGCSSSLVCLHQACETIRSGESQVSIVGAVETASGTSSAAALILKSLDAALRDGDRVHCVIKATGLSHNGRSKEVSIESEKQLIQGVYQRAGLNPNETAYLETNSPDSHAGSLAEILGGRLKADDQILVGSVSADLGHELGPVQGLAAIIRSGLAMNSGQANSASKPLRTSIHNNGCGGTNAHLVLESTPPSSQSSTETKGSLTGSEIPSRVFVLSAEDADTTRAVAKSLGSHLRQSINEGKKISPADLAYTLAERRSRLSYKAAIRAGNLEELTEALGRPDLKIRTTGSNKHRLGFVFNGQGAQWHAMGRELLSTYPVFASAIKEADGILRGFGADWSLEEELSRDAETTRVSEINISQPSTVALQLALVNLLRSWNIHPSAVVSHSTGEFAAAYAAGALSFSQALGIVYHLGDLARKYYGGSQSGAGGMAAAAIGAKEVEKYLTNTSAGGKVVVACINSPKSVTLSGDTEDLDEVLKRLDDDNVFARKLKVPLGYHSHHMLSFEAEYTERLRQLFSPTSKPGQTLPGEQVTYVSPVTGDVVTSPQEVLTPEYYVRNIISPVLFSDAFKAFSEHVDQVIEIGPHSTLSGPIREILRETRGEELGFEYMTCLKRPVDAILTMQDLACDLVTLGYPVSLRDVNSPSNKDQNYNFVADLPSYPWSGHVSDAATPEAEESSSTQAELDDVITTSKVSWELDILHNIPDEVKDTMRINLTQDELDREKILMRASYYLIFDAFQNLHGKVQDSWTPSQKQMYDWMAATVETGKQGGFGSGSALWSRATPGMKQLLYDELSQGKYGVAGELIAQLGAKLADLVQNQVTPAELAKATDELVHRYYTEVPMLKSRTYKQLSQVTELFALKNPGAKVLEIGGAGAGGMTRAVLETFGSRSTRGGTLLGNYVFTHKDPDALEKARQYLSSLDLDDDSLVEYKTLDIEQELPDSFPVGTFDLIAVAQTLGNQAGDLNKTLVNARRLLKPGGRLFLVGTTQYRLDIELVSRALSSYSSPLSIDKLHTTLREAGFTGVDFEIGDCEQPQYQNSSFIMSTAAPDTSTGFPSAVSVLYTTPIPESWHDRLAGVIRENIPNISTVEAKSWDTFEPPADGDDKRIHIFTGDLFGRGSLTEGTNESSLVKLQKLVQAVQNALLLSPGGVVDAQELSYATTFEFLRDLSLQDSTVGKRLVQLDVEFKGAESSVDSTIEHIVHVLQATMDDNVPLSDVDTEYTVRDGMLHIPRILPVEIDVAKDDNVAEESKLFTDPDATVLLIDCGNDNAGRIEELAKWLVDQGVRNLLVASNGSRPEALLRKIDEGKCNIQFRDCDISSESSVADLLKDVGSSPSVPSIRGVIVLDGSKGVHQEALNASDSEISSSALDQLKQAAERKIAGIRNLDIHLPSDLDFFVVLSPFNPSLAKRFSGSFSDSLPRERTKAGRPITVVHVPSGRAGFDRIDGDDTTSTTTVSVAHHLHRAISHAIQLQSISAENHQIIVGLPHWNKISADSPLKADPRFRTLQLGVQRKRRDAISSSEAAQTSSPSDLLLRFLDEKSEDGIVQALQAQLAVLLRTQAAEEIDPNKALATYGVDSIVAIEVRTWLAETTDGRAKLSVLEILNSDSLYRVAKMVIARAEKK
ncbi:hypothetical protein V8F20_010387 [Naviculisporaceae sp. PSN 640]